MTDKPQPPKGAEPVPPSEDAHMPLDAHEPDAPPRNQWADVWRQFKKHRGAFIAGIVFFAIIAAVFLGPLVWHAEAKLPPPVVEMIKQRDMRPIYTVLWDQSAKVDWAHPLGTDNLARDFMARLMLGGQVSILVGLAAMAVSIFLGTLVGLLAGFYRWLDGPLMRLTDLFLALPVLPLLLVAVLLFREPLKAAFGVEGGIFLLIVTLVGITSWMQTARIVRGDVLALKEREFVLAARSIGTTNRNLILRHILPNVLSPIMVSATLGIASAIITESALSFLGFGFPPDFPTWGKLLNDAVDRMVLYPERVIWPGLLISLTVLSVNYIGDGLRDALDPRIRGR